MDDWACPATGAPSRTLAGVQTLQHRISETGIPSVTGADPERAVPPGWRSVTKGSGQVRFG